MTNFFEMENVLSMVSTALSLFFVFPIWLCSNSITDPNWTEHIIVLGFQEKNRVRVIKWEGPCNVNLIYLRNFVAKQRGPRAASRCLFDGWRYDGDTWARGGCIFEGYARFHTQPINPKLHSCTPRKSKEGSILLAHDDLLGLELMGILQVGARIVCGIVVNYWWVCIFWTLGEQLRQIPCGRAF